MISEGEIEEKLSMELKFNVSSHFKTASDEDATNNVSTGILHSSHEG